MTALQTSFSYSQARQAEAKTNGKRPQGGVAEDLLAFIGARRFGTILVDPPWQFQNRTGKIAPEHKRLSRYGTLSLEGIKLCRSDTLGAHRVISRANELDQA